MESIFYIYPFQTKKFEYCLSKYEVVINDYVNRKQNRLRYTDDEYKGIAQAFAKKRNMFMHNSLEKFEDIHILAYSLARVLIYCMILEKAGINEKIITQVIDNLL